MEVVDLWCGSNESCLPQSHEGKACCLVCLGRLCRVWRRGTWLEREVSDTDRTEMLVLRAVRFSGVAEGADSFAHVLSVCNSLGVARAESLVFQFAYTLLVGFLGMEGGGGHEGCWEVGVKDN